jgi:hypothetical protein
MTETITSVIPLTINGLTWRKITDQIVTAIEGGSGYWCGSFKPADGRKIKTKVSPWYDDETIWAGDFRIEVADAEDGTKLFFTPESLQKGLQWLADNHLDRIEEIVKETGDAETADVFLQACVLGDIVYG